jgi:hypothetical protein
LFSSSNQTTWVDSLIQENPVTALSNKTLAEKACMSESSISRGFRPNPAPAFRMCVSGLVSTTSTISAISLSGTAVFHREVTGRKFRVGWGSFFFVPFCMLKK